MTKPRSHLPGPTRINLDTDTNPIVLVDETTSYTLVLIDQVLVYTPARYTTTQRIARNNHDFGVS